jgi:hypothetical protein
MNASLPAIGPILIIAALGILVGCTGDQPAKPKLIFLSRDGCVNTPNMRKNLDVALVKLSWQDGFEVVDAGKLPPSDPRRQYGTPTLLVDGKDLMGLPEPKPSDAEPG